MRHLLWNVWGELSITTPPSHIRIILKHTLLYISYYLFTCAYPLVTQRAAQIVSHCIVFSTVLQDTAYVIITKCIGICDAIIIYMTINELKQEIALLRQAMAKEIETEHVHGELLLALVELQKSLITAYEKERSE